MPNQIDKIYQFAPLTDYTLKKRVLIRFADLLFFGSIKILGAVTRFETSGTEHWDAIKTAGKIPIYTFWHDRIFLGTYFFRDRAIVVMTSKSSDGEYIARFIQRFGYGAIRGSTSRGGARALAEMVRSMRAGRPMAFSIDGPRGPRYVAKPGPVFLAKKTGNPILPLVVEPRKFWKLKSWDRLQIPWPFSRAITIFGEPIYVKADATDAECDEKLAELQMSLDRLTELGKKWRCRIS